MGRNDIRAYEFSLLNGGVNHGQMCCLIGSATILCAALAKKWGKARLRQTVVRGNVKTASGAFIFARRLNAMFLGR